MANRRDAALNGGPHTRMCTAKLVLIGMSAAGKTSLVVRYAKGYFREYRETTIGAAFATQTVNVGDTLVKLEIWDTAGQELYHSLIPLYYRAAKAAIVVYDITDQISFVRARDWVRELRREVPEIVIALAGNKADLERQRMVKFEEAQAYAEENGLIFMETSAKNGSNVNEIFQMIANNLPLAEGGGGAAADGARRLNDGERPRRSCCKS